MKKLLSIIVTSIFFLTCKESEISNIPITDVDGNVYSAVKIGKQIWLSENLKVTRLNNGMDIRNVADSLGWISLISPAYCWYRNDSGLYKKSYGALYNWYAVNSGKLCPAGWHVPEKTEWEALSANLGGSDIAGGKLKEEGILHWDYPNTGAVNSYGFSALPGGYRNYDLGMFVYLGELGFWWSSNEDNELSSPFFGMYSQSSSLDYNPYLSKKSGISVRCLKDY
jgi:uncharacterized protein (TIGR02145 family)